jgi:hypothetical protein
MKRCWTSTLQTLCPHPGWHPVHAAKCTCANRGGLSKIAHSSRRRPLIVTAIFAVSVRERVGFGRSVASVVPRRVSEASSGLCQATSGIGPRASLKMLPDNSAF